MTKRTLKYFYILLLYFIKNIIKPSKKNFKNKPALFISRAEGEKFKGKIAYKGYNNYLIIVKEKPIDNNKYQSSRILFNEHQIFESNAEIAFFKPKTFSISSLPVKKYDYIFISLIDFFRNFKSIFYYFIKSQYYIKSILFFPTFGLLCEKRNKHILGQARNFIPFNYSKVDFLKKIKSIGVNSVVLRGFENIDKINTYKEDIDILIDSKGINKLKALLNNQIGFLPLDLYSDIGETQTSYNGLPYYPFRLAKQILENKESTKYGFYIPNKQQHLLSYIYHIVFHKSVKSGIKITDNVENDFKSKKNYLCIVEKLFEKNKVKLNKYTLEELFYFLKKNNWFPEYDLVLKLHHQKQDLWYNHLFKFYRNDVLKSFQYTKGISVFFLREKACNENKIELFNKKISTFGFYNIDSFEINNKVQESVNNNVRGGKWDIGPYEINAGYPKYCFILYDPFYTKPDEVFSKQYPHLENKKSAQVKLLLRNELNAVSKKSMNSIHSSDDFYEAIFYLHKLGFSEMQIKKIIDSAITIQSSVETKYKVIKDYSRFAVRSKVELIEYKGNRAILKRYKSNKLEYLENEIWFLKNFQEHPLVPKFIYSDDNYLIIEYFENAKMLSDSDVNMSINHILQLQSFFKLLYRKGVTLIDVNPTNLLLTKDNNLKIIDFEYAQKYIVKPKKIQEIYELSSFSIENVKKFPSGHEHIIDAYATFLLKKTFLFKNQFLTLKNPSIISFIRTINKFFISLNSIGVRLNKRFKRELNTLYFKSKQV